MLCGTHNFLGLNLDFYHCASRQFWAKAQGRPHQQAYSGILHGEFLTALLDARMCQAIFAQGIEAVTTNMSIRYLHEEPVSSWSKVRHDLW